MTERERLIKENLFIINGKNVKKTKEVLKDNNIDYLIVNSSNKEDTLKLLKALNIPKEDVMNGIRYTEKDGIIREDTWGNIDDWDRVIPYDENDQWS